MTSKVRKLIEQDVDSFSKLLRVFHEAVETDGGQLPSPTHLSTLLRRPNFWVFTAETDEQVMGGLTAYVLPQYYTAPPQVYLYDLAVCHDYQRQGIGKRLLTALTDSCQSEGVDLAFVQADGDDTDAIDFSSYGRFYGLCCAVYIPNTPLKFC